MLALLIAAAMALPQVDASLHGTEADREAVAFADELHGWLSDPSGHVYETADGGVSWKQLAKNERGLETPGIRAFVWPTPRIGLTFYSRSRTGYRTTDGGATWSAVQLPSELSPTEDASGGRLWSCGEHQQIFHSDDAGATWQQAATPFGPGESCWSLSFSDARHGWAANRKHLYQTVNGGETWQELKLPAAEIDRALYGGTAGWVATFGEIYVTRDGGAHWTASKRQDTQEEKAKHLFVSRLGSRNVVTWNRGVAVGELMPFFPGLYSDAVAMGGRGVFHHSGYENFTVFRDGELLRSGPVTLRTGAPQRETLLEVSPFDEKGKQTGWSQTHFYRSEDDGRSWYVSGDMPGKPKRVQRTGEHTLRAETSDGWYESTWDGWHWTRSDNQAWAQHDFELASGSATVSPLSCTLTSRSGELTVRYGERGCFNESTNELKLSWQSDGWGRISGSIEERGGSRKTVGDSVLTSAQVREILSSIIAATERQEDPGECGSTTSNYAALTWSCGGWPHELRFSKSQCGQSPAPYARAVGLIDAAGKALQAAR